MTPAGLTGNQPYQQTPPAHTPSHEDLDKLQSQLLNEQCPASSDTQGKTRKRTRSCSVRSGARASVEEQSPRYKKVEGGYQCDHCDKRFTFLSQAKTHRRIHSGEKPCEYEHCGKKFSDPSSLRRHLRTHADKKEFKCLHCDYRANYKGNLAYHLKTKHQAPDPAKPDAPPAKKQNTE